MNKNLKRPIILLFFLFCASLLYAQKKDTTVTYVGMRYDRNNASANLLINPERGFRDEIMFDVSSKDYAMFGGGYGQIAPRAKLTRESYGGTVLQTYFYLHKYTKTDIPAAAIQEMKAILEGYRMNGIKALLRFCYDWDPDRPLGDGKYAYTVDDITRHMYQVKSFVNEYKDVIYAFQFGWVGAWGEWHNSYYQHEKYADATSVIANTFYDIIPAAYRISAFITKVIRVITRNPFVDHI